MHNLHNSFRQCTGHVHSADDDCMNVKRIELVCKYWYISIAGVNTKIIIQDSTAYLYMNSSTGVFHKT